MNSAPARIACAPDCQEKLSTSCASRFFLPVGEPESVPKDATPEMDTAGPIASDGGASNALFQNWPRVSFTARGDRVDTLLTATTWSVLSRLADAAEALMPPAP